jgi:transposase
MRGSDERSGELFSYVDLEDRVPAKHPLRLIRRIVNEVLVALDCEFTKLYADSGRPSIPPERLLRALLLQAFYTNRSETQLGSSSTITCCTAGLSGSASTSRCGCRQF